MIGRGQAGRRVAPAERAAYTDRLAAVDRFADYCPNDRRVQRRSDSDLPIDGVTAGSVPARRRQRGADEGGVAAPRLLTARPSPSVHNSE